MSQAVTSSSPAHGMGMSLSQALEGAVGETVSNAILRVLRLVMPPMRWMALAYSREASGNRCGSVKVLRSHCLPWNFISSSIDVRSSRCRGGTMLQNWMRTGGFGK